MSLWSCRALHRISSHMAYCPAYGRSDPRHSSCRIIAAPSHVNPHSKHQPITCPSVCPQSLPINDTWLVAGQQWAAAARTTLDDLSLSGGVTSSALTQLNRLVSEGQAAGCMHLCGTYPHDQWQGSRLEGFVVAQGQAVNEETQQVGLGSRSNAWSMCRVCESAAGH